MRFTTFRRYGHPYSRHQASSPLQLRIRTSPEETKTGTRLTSHQLKSSTDCSHANCKISKQYWVPQCHPRPVSHSVQDKSPNRINDHGGLRGREETAKKIIIVCSTHTFHLNCTANYIVCIYCERHFQIHTYT